MSQRLKLIVAYDGAPFSGWQSQANRNGVQDHLERAFERVSGERVRVHGAGRTDAGVHALAQCAHVDLAKKRLLPERWLKALNASLPSTIRILRCHAVSKQFHARFSAKAKTYRYRIWSGPVLPPLEHGRAWHVISKIDMKRLESAARNFVGTHNFAGFSANRGQAESDTVRTLHNVRIRKRGAEITLDFVGDGFLYKMVRLIVGSLVQCATDKMSIQELVGRLSNWKNSGDRLTAPAHGLFLIRVRY